MLKASHIWRVPIKLSRKSGNKNLLSRQRRLSCPTKTLHAPTLFPNLVRSGERARQAPEQARQPFGTTVPRNIERDPHAFGLGLIELDYDIR